VFPNELSCLHLKSTILMEMGEDYLNCGNGKLESAAYQWVIENGYVVTNSMGNSVTWGSSK